VLNIPLNLASRLPSVAEKLQGSEKTIIDLCRSPEFSVAKLGEVMKAVR
jgi:hypothetical protein